MDFSSHSPLGKKKTDQKGNSTKSCSPLTFNCSECGKVEINRGCSPQFPQSFQHRIEFWGIQWVIKDSKIIQIISIINQRAQKQPFLPCANRKNVVCCGNVENSVETGETPCSANNKPCSADNQGRKKQGVLQQNALLGISFSVRAV